MKPEGLKYAMKWDYLQKNFPKEYQRVIDFENGAADFLEKIYELSKKCDELQEQNEYLMLLLSQNNIEYTFVSGNTSETIK